MTDRLPASECASWCKTRAGHTDLDEPADRHCESPSLSVPLSLHPMLDVGTQPPVPDRLVGSLQREDDASAPHIVVRHNDGIMIDLSIEDARRLAEELLTLAEAAE
jgi:hypothetical protein